MKSLHLFVRKVEYGTVFGFVLRGRMTDAQCAPNGKIFPVIYLWVIFRKNFEFVVVFSQLNVEVIVMMQAMKDVESMKTQSENLAAEYDRWAQIFYQSFKTVL